MNTAREGNAIRFTQVESLAALRGKIRAFKDLYGEEPQLSVMGYFTDTATSELVFLNREAPVLMSRSLVRVNLGSEGIAMLSDAADVAKVTWYIRAKVTT